MQARVYKVLRPGEWKQLEASGVFSGSPDDQRDGFIHLSSREQLKGTLERHFAGEHELAVLEIDAAALGERLRWEASRGGALFPHLYGDLAIHAVLRRLDEREL